MHPHTTSRRVKQDGFTIIELMLAIVILAIAMGAVAFTLTSTLRHTQQSTGRSVASNLVSEEMEIVRQMSRANFTSIPEGETVRTEDVDGVPYTVTRSATFVSENSTTDACTDSNSSRAFLRVGVSVAWPGMKGVEPANAETILTPPVGAFDPSKGHVAVSVVGQGNTPKGSIRVRLKEGAAIKEQVDTNSDGCAFFSYVTPGSYTVELHEAQHVDDQNVASPSQTVDVLEGSVVSREFNYDDRSALEITRVDATDDGAAIPQGAALVIANNALLPNKRKIYPYAGLGPQNITSVFPYDDGYQVWVGGCADADPEGTVLAVPGDPGSAEPRYPDSSRGAPLPMTPGMQTNAPGFLAALVVRVVEDDGSPFDNASIRLVHEPDEQCTAGETLTYPGLKTDSDGLALIAVPLGQWTIEIPGASPKATWPSIQIDPPLDLTGRTVLVETNE